jgi:hypothetical protein
MKTVIRMLALAATGCGAAVMFTASTATADRKNHCENVSGQLEEDLADPANCPADHPRCFTGAIDGHHIHATTQFFGEGAVAAPPASPNWFAYSGVTTYTMEHGSITTRETGLVTNVPIPDAELPNGRASLSMEVITSGTGDLAGATGYLFVNGFVDDTNHVSSLVMGKICRP